MPGFLGNRRPGMDCLVITITVQTTEKDNNVQEHLQQTVNLTEIHTHTHTHVYGPLSRTTRVSWYQKGKTNPDFTEARDSEWQWHQLGICKSAPCSRQITMPAPHHSVFYRPDALPATQPTVSKH